MRWHLVRPCRSSHSSRSETDPRKAAQTLFLGTEMLKLKPRGICFPPFVCCLLRVEFTLAADRGCSSQGKSKDSLWRVKPGALLLVSSLVVNLTHSKWAGPYKLPWKQVSTLSKPATARTYTTGEGVRSSDGQLWKSCYWRKRSLFLSSWVLNFTWFFFYLFCLFKKKNQTLMIRIQNVSLSKCLLLFPQSH